MKWFEKHLLLHYDVVWPPIMKEDHQIMKWYFKKKNGVFMSNNIKYRVKQHITFCT